MKLRTKALVGITVVAMVAASAYVAGWLTGNAGQELNLVGEVRAAQTKGSGAVQKGVYFAYTESLAPDEMRVISLGTGLPIPLTKAQKSSS